MSGRTSRADQVLALLQEFSPGLELNVPVFQALQEFFSGQALIPTGLDDLHLFLQGEKLYRVVVCRQDTMHQCALELIDHYPEYFGAQGMLRLYRCQPPVSWQDCEQAESAIGQALTMDAYGWQPDAFTVFANAPANWCELMCIAAFD